MYAIIDVETTGYSYAGNRITDIAIFIHDGTKIVKEFHSLVNPECTIPYQITQLTGISNEMVKSAPKFYEIAKEIVEFTKDQIFVAHNVNFDYNVLREEFKTLGADFKRKKLCTIRLSRKLIPGLPSYSLGNLCASVGIKINGRHRAYGDAFATTELFEMLLQKDEDDIILESLKPQSKEATLPPLLSRKVFDELSPKTGVYYFHNKEGKIIYVGKAKNIKQRVLGHFRDKSKKEVDLSRNTANVTYMETGSELVALLFESAEIKRLYPFYNRMQKRTDYTYGIFRYEDRKGIVRLGFGHLKTIVDPITSFYNVQECRSFMEKLVEEFVLCPKCCNIQSSVASCFYYQIKKCKGVCCGKENVNIYNLRVERAIESLVNMKNDFAIIEPGRKKNEKAVVLIEDGIYKGFGYLKNKNGEISFDACRKAIQQQQDNKDIQRILRMYLNNSDPEGIRVVSKLDGVKI